MKRKSSYSVIGNILFYSKKQWHYSKKSIFFLLLTIPLTLFKAFLGVYIPKVAINLVLSQASEVQIIQQFVIIGVSLLIVNLVDFVINRFRFPLSLKYRYGMIEEKVSKAYFTDYRNLENPNFRALMARADESLWGSGKGSVIEQLTGDTVELISSVLCYILFGAILTSINPWIAVILTITSLINYFSLKACHNFWHSNREELSKIEKKIMYILRNFTTFEGAADIRLYGMNEWFLSLFKLEQKKRSDIEKRHYKKLYISNIIDAMLILIRDGMAYWILIFMVMKRGLPIDDFVLGFTAIGTFAGTIGGIISKVSSITKNSLIASDFRDYMNYKEFDNRGKSEKKVDFNSCGEINIENVSFKYEGASQNTLSDINLTIKKGEKIAIVGLNGAGKTTLVKLICGLYTPTSGNVYIDGCRKCEYNIYDYYSIFSTVFQDFYLLPVSIASNISAKNELNTDREKVIESLRIAGLWKKIEQLELGIDSMLDKQLNQNAVEFSGGEKQKLILARAIYKNAPILILDEPTAALDPIAEEKLYRKYNDFTKGKTSIFISHRLASTRFCNRIVFLDGGRVAEVGTHEELMKREGKYAELFNLQSEYYR